MCTIFMLSIVHFHCNAGVSQYMWAMMTRREPRLRQNRSPVLLSRSRIFFYCPGRGGVRKKHKGAKTAMHHGLTTAMQRLWISRFCFRNRNEIAVQAQDSRKQALCLV